MVALGGSEFAEGMSVEDARDAAWSFIESLEDEHH